MDKLKNKIKTIFNKSFLKDVIKVSLGTMAGRAITILTLPLITRLYSPKDFAILATYAAIVSIVSIAACLRFEVAIPIAENDKEAKNLLLLSFISLVCVSGVTLFIAFLIHIKLINIFERSEILPYIFLIPIGILGTGIYSIMQYWATRSRRFTQIAKTRINQALISVTTTLSLGWYGLTPLGLLIGNILNTSAGGINLLKWSIKNEKDKIIHIKYEQLLETLKKYKKFPIYSTPESIFNNAGAQIPIILVSFLAGEEAGFLLLATQIMAAPMQLLGGSIAQVYMTRAPEAWANDNLRSFTHSIMINLLKVSLVTFIIIGCIAPFLIPYVFGSNWSRTGQIIGWMAPWMILQFVASPVSISLHITGKQAYAMILQAFGLIFRPASIIISSQTIPNKIIETFAIASAIFYMTCLITIINNLNCRKRII